jgi:hypothetical protein
MNDNSQGSVDRGGKLRRGTLRRVAAAGRWLNRVDPGTHRRIKGLRLVTAYGIAVALGTLQDIAHSVPSSISLGYLAGSFALWASVSEGKTMRAESSRDLVLLSFAAALGAGLFVVFSRPLQLVGRAGPELVLLTGTFLVGYLKRFGILGAGAGSQIYIGELLAYGARLTISDLWAIGIAALIAALASVVPRVLSGPSRQRCSLPDQHPLPGGARRSSSWDCRRPSVLWSSSP